MKRISKSIYLISIVAIILNMLLVLNINVIAASVSGKLNESNIRLRKEPNTTSEVIRNLYKTDGVDILGKVDDWYKIKYENSVGYMKQEFIDITSGKKEDVQDLKTENTQKPEKVGESEKTNNEAKKTEENVNKKEEAVKEEKAEKIEFVVKKDSSIKTYPVIYAREKQEVKKGDKVKKIDEIGKWTKIKTEQKQGWILSIELE